MFITISDSNLYYKVLFVSSAKRLWIVDNLFEINSLQMTIILQCTQTAWYLLCSLPCSHFYRWPLPPKMQSSAESCQIAQTKRKWSSDELRNGSHNKEMIILQIK